jgi:predicted dithiol-disulfide oxidoreductase (DUF899 family)
MSFCISRLPHSCQSGKIPAGRRSPLERSFLGGNHRLLSSASNTYNRDYHGESADGKQIPALNVFLRRDGAIRHFYQSELMFAPKEPGQDPRHVDMIWPLWNLFDYTPEGRGETWRPKLSY